MTDDIDRMARAICQERCAFMGEPACWQLNADDGRPYPFPPEGCDEPGCVALAKAARAAVVPIIEAREREKVASELEALAETLEAFAKSDAWPKAQRKAYANQADTFRMKAAALRARTGETT